MRRGNPVRANLQNLTKRRHLRLPWPPWPRHSAQFFPILKIVATHA